MSKELQNEIKLLKEKVALLEKCVKLNDELEQFKKLAQPMKEYIPYPYPVYPNYPVYPTYPTWRFYDTCSSGTTTVDCFPSTTTTAHLNPNAQISWTS
jgi:hypothetical protein